MKMLSLSCGTGSMHDSRNGTRAVSNTFTALYDIFHPCLKHFIHASLPVQMPSRQPRLTHHTSLMCHPSRFTPASQRIGG